MKKDVVSVGVVTTPLLTRTKAKMLASQQKKKEILEYIKEHYPSYLANPQKEIRVRECCNVLRFVNYGKGKQKLYRANFCKYDIFCVACATRRSIKMIQKFVKGIYANGLEEKNRH